MHYKLNSKFYLPDVFLKAKAKTLEPVLPASIMTA